LNGLNRNNKAKKEKRKKVTHLSKQYILWTVTHHFRTNFFKKIKILKSTIACQLK